ncbi:MAG: hypothetical protein IIA73_06570 [Proteobacteria bacterium]|nr:hypothetical protein [Pseudomonadota bacterium]
MTRVSLHRVISVSAGVFAMAVIAAPLQYQSDGSFVLESPAFAQAGGGGGGGQGAGRAGGAGSGGQAGGDINTGPGGGGGLAAGGAGGGGGGGGLTLAGGNNPGGSSAGGFAGDQRGDTDPGGGGEGGVVISGDGGGHPAGLGNTSGAIASALGALNAAHASETALANAAPNSRVGLIASYIEAVETTETIAALLNAAQATLSGLTAVPEADLTAARNAVATLTGERDVLQIAADDAADLATANPGDEDLATAADEAQSLLDDKIDELADAQAILDPLEEQQQTYEDAVADVTLQEANLDEATEAEAEALSAAANKDVDDEVTLAVNALLGL